MAARRADPAVDSARRLLEHLGRAARLPLTLQLWDGSRIQLGDPTEGEVVIDVKAPAVIGGFLRRPTLDTLFRLYALGGIEPAEGDLLEILDILQRRRKQHRVRLGEILRGLPWRDAWHLARITGPVDQVAHAYNGGGKARDDKALVQFHYDASNAFYRLFLDPWMVYSCAYFKTWETDLATAQTDKLDLICRKLRLAPGERLLDIGCGWGALVCYAARHYGVRAHGVTLSQAQYDHAQALVQELGLADRVTIELRDYRELEGIYDKIASIGMYEHVGIDTYPTYFKKIRSLLADDGILLNHGITRRAKRERRAFRRPSASRRIILKYIFPGAELDHIGHTLEVMESCGFEVHDVEGLRRHYARTCRLWYQRLLANRGAALENVGPERLRMWLAYLAGVAIGFERGPLRLFQVVATRQRGDGTAPLPPTRADLFATVASTA